MECEHSRLIKREHELVCRDCGLVVSDFELALPLRQSPPGGRDGVSPWDYTSFANTMGKLTGRERAKLAKATRPSVAHMLGRLGGGERTEAHLVTRITTIAEKLNLPKRVQEQAAWEAERLLRKMRSGKMRMTVSEMATVALWSACKIMNFPLSMVEYAAALRWQRGNRLYKLLSKAHKLAKLPSRVFEAKDYVGRVAAKLQDMAEPRYLSALELYAHTIIDASRLLPPDENPLRGKKPVCGAAAALCAADEIFGGWIGKERIAEATGAGPSLGSLAYELKTVAPPPPDAIRDFTLELVQKRAVEREADEIVRTITS